MISLQIQNARLKNMIASSESKQEEDATKMVNIAHDRLDLKKEKFTNDVGKTIFKNWIPDRRFVFVFDCFSAVKSRIRFLFEYFLLILFSRHCDPT